MILIDRYCTLAYTKRLFSFLCALDFHVSNNLKKIYNVNGDIALVFSVILRYKVPLIVEKLMKKLKNIFVVNMEYIYQRTSVVISPPSPHQFTSELL